MDGTVEASLSWAGMAPARTPGPIQTGGGIVRHAIVTVAVVVAATVVLAARPAGGEPVATPADTLIAFTCLDQFDRAHTDAELRDRVAVLLWADRAGNDHRRRWQRLLARELREEIATGTVAMRDVAHARGVPGFVKGMVKGSFSDDRQEWALLDWEGVFADAYAPTEGHLNVLVFAAGGALRLHEAVTDLERAALGRMVAAVRAALADGPPGPPDPPAVRSE